MSPLKFWMVYSIIQYGPFPIPATDIHLVERENDGRVMGPYYRKKDCERKGGLMQKDPALQWVYRCVTDEEYRLYYLHYPIDDDS